MWRPGRSTAGHSVKVAPEYTLTEERFENRNVVVEPSKPAHAILCAIWYMRQCCKDAPFVMKEPTVCVQYACVARRQRHMLLLVFPHLPPLSGHTNVVRRPNRPAHAIRSAFLCLPLLMKGDPLSGLEPTTGCALRVGRRCGGLCPHTNEKYGLRRGHCYIL